MVRHATSTSFKKGNTAANGNDKTLRLSTWLDSELQKELEEVDDYGEKMRAVKKLARKIVHTALVTEDPKTLKDYAEFLRDSTEGKPKQVTEVSGTDGGPLTVQLVQFAELSTEEETEQ